MAKDPDKRYPSAKALVAALRDASGKKKLARVVGAPRRMWLPAVIGVGVLGVGVVGVIAVRGGPTRDASAPSPASGFVEVEVRSNPRGASVFRGERSYGTAPIKLDARPQEKLELVLKKPGYNTEEKTIVAGDQPSTVDVILHQANGFEGTWVLPDGQLRVFQRSGDEHVDVFKLASLTSEKAFYRKFLLEDAPAGIKFSSTETIVDQRAPAEPSCQVPVRVEYVYDPANDSLEVHPEDVETGFQNGRCVVHSRELALGVQLVRADRDADTRMTRAPVGKPLDAPTVRTRPDPKELDEKQLLQLKEAEAKKRANTRKPTKGDLDNAIGDLQESVPTKGKKPPPQKAPAPKQQTKAPEPRADELQQQAVPNAPPQQTPNPPVTRGDSQVAPPVTK